MTTKTNNISTIEKVQQSLEKVGYVTDVELSTSIFMLTQINKPLLIDVRTLEEFKAGAIPGAMHLDRGKLEFLVEGKIADKGTPILVFCQSGGRGTLATMTLKKMGYFNVKNIKGGFLAWKKAGYPVKKAG